jgi:DNA-binding response OmpR family regulator
LAKILMASAKPNFKLIGKLWSLDHDLLLTNNPEELSFSSHMNPDLYLIEENRPEMNGLSVCKTIKNASSIPIILMSDTQIHVLEELWRAGVDEVIKRSADEDYVITRIDHLIKKYLMSNKYNIHHQADSCVDYSFIKLFREKKKVVLLNQELTLTPTEYRLLEILLIHPEKVFSRETLMNMIWGSESIPDERAIDIQISRIRKKLGAYASIIKTVWGMGYKFEINTK